MKDSFDDIKKIFDGIEERDSQLTARMRADIDRLPQRGAVRKRFYKSRFALAAAALVCAAAVILPLALGNGGKPHTPGGDPPPAYGSLTPFGTVNAESVMAQAAVKTMDKAKGASEMFASGNTPKPAALPRAGAGAETKALPLSDSLNVHPFTWGRIDRAFEFSIDLTDYPGYIAELLGEGVCRVIVADFTLFDQTAPWGEESMIIFVRDGIMRHALSDGGRWEGENWTLYFSSHKRIEGSAVVKELDTDSFIADVSCNQGKYSLVTGKWDARYAIDTAIYYPEIAIDAETMIHTGAGEVFSMLEFDTPHIIAEAAEALQVYDAGKGLHSLKVNFRYRNGTEDKYSLLIVLGEDTELIDLSEESIQPGLLIRIDYNGEFYGETWEAIYALKLSPAPSEEAETETETETDWI